MASVTGPQPARTSPGRVLLIGDVGKALLDAQDMDRRVFEVRANILDGIDAAARSAFDAVGIIMNGVSSQLAPALKALRRSTVARIVLLAQMHEEPVARRLVTEIPGQERLADEYRVCPVRLANLVLRPGREKGAGSRPQPQGSDGKSRSPSAGSLGSSPPSVAPPSELEQRFQCLEQLATTDDLTGLKNRRYLGEFAKQILDRARRTRGRVTILVFDIDNFKHYNDEYGHRTGDEILRQAAILMRRCCRPHDVVGRVGGDEFAVVFWDDPHHAAGDAARERRSSTAEHPTEVLSVAKRFQQALSDTDLHLLGSHGEGVLTISGGLASFPRDGSTVEQLFERADHALLEAKRNGKNRIHLVGEPQSGLAQIE